MVLQLVLVSPSVEGSPRNRDPHEHRTRQHDLSANMTCELPAGSVGFASGFEYRRESAFDSPDAYVTVGTLLTYTYSMKGTTQITSGISSYF